MAYNDINKRIIPINLLPVVVCNANTRRKVGKLIRDKISIYAVDFFFIVVMYLGILIIKRYIIRHVK
ncbi:MULTISPECIES: hypothetical protein [Clostridium]|uniref:hypothetical protein n=1 Tax=Clostridium TaxID=1485 RepID=UPI0032EBF652